ncbi:MAG: DUF4886 domain-containing protein [Oscillospiraceae bacterium]|nr:DUF4886 domain-containing protein [Oscillospiraceae bacterium]
MRILSIGNSFSQDAQRYLHRLALKEGVQMKCVNLYIGGCPLRTHYLNMLDDCAAYAFEFNSEGTGLKVSIRQALVSDNWDYITLQQASYDSVTPSSYTPYIEELAAYVRKYCPKAKLLIHQTWAYEDASTKLAKLERFATDTEMFAAAEDAYNKAAALISADGIIPAGKAMITAAHAGIEKIHRDGLHASLGAGRYLLALCWFKYLTGRDITENTFDEFDVPVTEEERKIVIAAVNSAFGG